MGRSLISLAQLLENDLEAICGDLARGVRRAGREAAADHRRRRLPRLLPRAGGAALEPHADGGARDRRHRVRQLHARRAGLARGAARDPHLTLVAPRHDPAAAARHAATSTTIIHAAGIASPIYYRAQPLAVHRRQHQRPAQPARLRGRASATPARPLDGLPLLLLERDLRRPGRRTRSRRRRPTAATCPAPGPRACYDEIEALRRDAVRHLRAARGPAGARSRGRSTTTGPGLKITDGRVLPDFARDVLAGATSSCSRTARRRAPSATRPTRSSATTRCWCAGATASRTTSASTGRRSRWRELAELVIEHARELFGYRGKVVLGKAPGGRLPGRQPESALPGDRQGARAARLRPEGARSTKASTARSSGTATTATRGRRLMRDLDHRHRLRRPRDRRLPRRPRARRHLRRRRPQRRSTRSTRGARRSTRTG